MSGDPTTAPEPDAIVWRDQWGDHWRFSDHGGQKWDRENGCCSPGWSCAYPDRAQLYVDEAWGPLVAVGHLPAWTGPGDDVEPDDVPAVTP